MRIWAKDSAINWIRILKLFLMDHTPCWAWMAILLSITVSHSNAELKFLSDQLENIWGITHMRRKMESQIPY